jgi:hypothetical protein
MPTPSSNSRALDKSLCCRSWTAQAINNRSLSVNALHGFNGSQAGAVARIALPLRLKRSRFACGTRQAEIHLRVAIFDLLTRSNLVKRRFGVSAPVRRVFIYDSTLSFVAHQCQGKKSPTIRVLPCFYAMPTLRRMIRMLRHTALDLLPYTINGSLCDH